MIASRHVAGGAGWTWKFDPRYEEKYRFMDFVREGTAERLLGPSKPNQTAPQYKRVLEY